MDELNQADLQGKKFVCSSGDLAKLSSDAGCQFNLVSNQTYSLDDDSFSDDDEGFGDYSKQLTQSARKERMKRDLITLSLNSNRDPTTNRKKPNLAKLLGDDDDETTYRQPGESGMGAQIHNRYRGVKDFDKMLKDDENKFEEISIGKVYKRRLTPGFGELINDDCIVIYNCAFWTESASEPYDSTWLRQSAIVSDLSQDSLLPGVYDLLLSAKMGEWCEAIIRPEAAFGKLGVSPRIPPNATIFCILEVIKVIKRDKISNLTFELDKDSKVGVTFEDYYQASNEARMRGNHYFSQKKYKVAIQRYKAGINVLETLVYKDENEENRAKELLLRLYNNVARAANSSGEPRLALHACKQATMIKDHDSKTYWNKMVAWKKLGHFDKAQGVARRALQIFDDQTTRFHFHREVNELKERIQNEQNELDNLYRAMGRALA